MTVNNPIKELAAFIRLYEYTNPVAHEHLKEWYNKYVHEVHANYALDVRLYKQAPEGYIKSILCKQLADKIGEHLQMERNEQPFQTIYRLSTHLLINKEK
jgi:hypothetical protein